MVIIWILQTLCVSVAVVSHTPIDQIENKGTGVVSVGGPTSYGGLTAKSCGFNVKLVTKIGLDFPEDFKDLLRERGLTISSNCISNSKPTTRFKLVLKDHERDLFLLARCDDITADDIEFNTDACIVSPIINEVRADAFTKISQKTGFIFLDPQGLVRKVRNDGSCYIGRTEMSIDRRKINAIKVDEEEAFALTGERGIDALKTLGIETAILTSKNKTTMLHQERLYAIATELIEAKDSTGIGDIFAGAYTCAFVENSDAKWALCFGVAAAVTALKTNTAGISKIPMRKDVEEYASTLHDRLKILSV
jgi:sugar/nucleoside kinase (ribokinase family)